MATININPESFNNDQYPRNLARIACEIMALWKKPSMDAQPYLNAMLHIHSTSPDAEYYAEDAQTIVMYFLANAQGFRGADARRIKQELKQQYNIK